MDYLIKIRKIDLSFNRLTENLSDFLFFTNLVELNLSHNNYTVFPRVAVTDAWTGGDKHKSSVPIKNLKQLTILDMSYNSLYCGKDERLYKSFKDFSDISFSSIQKLIPDVVFRSVFLTFADLSHSRISDWSIVLHENGNMDTVFDDSVHKTVNLNSNKISNFGRMLFL